MASILSAIAWLIRCDANDERDPLGEAFENDRSSRGVQLVRVSEGQTGQMLLGFFKSLRFLIQTFFPGSVPLIPALPQARISRYVKHSAMEKLVKSDKALHKDEECYICLRPIGTKHLASKEAASSATAAFVLSPSSKLDVGETEQGDADENECSGSSSSDGENDGVRGEKGLSHSSKQRVREHPESRRQQHQQPQEGQGQQEERRRRRRQRRENSPPRLILELPCGHRFCDGCVRRWLSSHASCPTCRYQFPERSCEVVKEP